MAEEERALTAYERWMEREGLPVLGGHGVTSLLELELGPWGRMGGRGAYFDFTGMEGLTGMYVTEIPPGASLNPERHMYEETMYVLRGKGATSIWSDGGPKQTFEWQEGSLFSPPLNTWHQHFNGTNEPVRLLSVTDGPLVMDLFHNEDFIFKNPFVFTDRYSGQPDYFTVRESRDQTAMKESVWRTNFIADVKTATVDLEERKSARGRITLIEPADNTMICHIAEWPMGTYHKAHYHGSGAIVLILQSVGYTLLWPKELGIHPYEDGKADRVVRMDWKPGSALCPPDGWFHQHFNTGTEPARYLALRFGGRKHLQKMELARKGRLGGSIISIKKGGTMIEYEDEDPQIRKTFEEELRRNGVEMAMPAVRLNPR